MSNNCEKEEIEILRARVKKLECALRESTDWLQSAWEIITDADMGDEDDDERCLEMIKDANQLLSEKFARE